MLNLSISYSILLAIKDYINNNPNATAWDIVQHFKNIGEPEVKILTVLREIYG